jgi:hypothetical protein
MFELSFMPKHVIFDLKIRITKKRFYFAPKNNYDEENCHFGCG